LGIRHAVHGEVGNLARLLGWRIEAALNQACAIGKSHAGDALHGRDGAPVRAVGATPGVQVGITPFLFCRLRSNVAG